MTLHLKICIVLVALIIILLSLQVLRKGRVPVKYFLLWFASALLILAIAVFPGFLGIVSSLVGFQTISNMIIGLFIIVLLFITAMLTIIVSGQKEKNTLLIQELSILKNEIDTINDKAKK